ncbi:MAG TPA: hypothetical protein VMW22_03385 [Candidatus Desulfaltia sp.]|nr:hypothetical protein [Candidatus Desulfaltia sp.]
MSLRGKKLDYNKKVLIGGTLVILVAAVAGSQFFVEGRVYHEKVEALRSRGFEMNGTLPWSGLDAWEEQVKEKYRYRINVERKEVTDWDTFYSYLKTAKSKVEYDGSIYDGVHYCDETYAIWFSTIQLRSTTKRGEIITYYTFPDG